MKKLIEFIIYIHMYYKDAISLMKLEYLGKDAMIYIY